jgi:hypothetical protein
LQGGISGPIYIGAGGNDVTTAIDVGIWVATANAQGRVTVTYLLNPPYSLAAVHVQLACLPVGNCNPDHPTPLVYPTCSGGLKAYLIVNASINILTVTGACPPPKAI